MRMTGCSGVTQNCVCNNHTVGSRVTREAWGLLPPSRSDFGGSAETAWRKDSLVQLIGHLGMRCAAAAPGGPKHTVSLQFTPE